MRGECVALEVSGNYRFVSTKARKFDENYPYALQTYFAERLFAKSIRKLSFFLFVDFNI